MKKKQSKYLEKQGEIFKTSLEEFSNRNAKLLSDEEMSFIIKDRMDQVDNSISDCASKKSAMKSAGKYRVKIVKGALVPIVLLGVISLSTYAGYAIFHNPNNKKNDYYYCTSYEVTCTTIDNVTYEKNEFSFTTDDDQSLDYNSLLVIDPISDSDYANMYYSTNITDASAELVQKRLEEKDETFSIDPNDFDNYVNKHSNIVNPRHDGKQYIAVETREVTNKEVNYSDKRKDGYKSPYKNGFKIACGGLSGLGVLIGSFVAYNNFIYSYRDQEEFEKKKKEYKDSKRKMKSLMK